MIMGKYLSICFIDMWVCESEILKIIRSWGYLYFGQGSFIVNCLDWLAKKAGLCKQFYFLQSWKQMESHCYYSERRGQVPRTAEGTITETREEPLQRKFQVLLVRHIITFGNSVQVFCNGSIRFCGDMVQGFTIACFDSINLYFVTFLNLQHLILKKQQKEIVNYILETRVRSS